MSVTVDKKKRLLRKRYLAARKELTPNEVYSKSRFIFSNLINTEVYKKAETVHCYVSINRQNEAETRNLIQFMLGEGKVVVVPKMEVNGKLSHYKIRDLEELNENRWGVAEPDGDNSRRADVIEFDLIIVPMVAGDKQKNRLGYGKGYYDRFLSGLNTTKAGLLFDLQLCETKLPTDKYDVKMDMLITESAILE